MTNVNPENAPNCDAFAHEASDKTSPEPLGPSEPASRSLSEAVERMKLVVDPAMMEPLDRYCQLLWDWNTKINLTRHTDYDKFVRRDLLDTLKLAEQLAEGEDILDIGSGGGVPGIPLAIVRPDLNVSVCDSVAKKSRALDDMVRKLQLHVPVHAARAQDVLEDLRFHSLVTRAAGNIRQLMNWLSSFWMSFDRLLAIKGPRWVTERGDARHRGLLNEIDLRKLTDYEMPGTESRSVILQFKRIRPGDDA